MDDEVNFNTQCSTQWDGFRHVAYQNYPEGSVTFHGGMTPEEAADPNNTKFGTGRELPLNQLSTGNQRS